MYHKLTFITFSFLFLANCQAQKTSESTVKKTGMEQTQANSDEAMPSEAAPKMSEGFPSEPKPGSKAAELNAKVAAAQNAGIVSLKEGQNIFLEEQKMNVTFKKINEDSRCPKGTNCIWEGVASVEVEFVGLATRPRTYKISTIDNASKGYEKTIVFDGYEISLVDISPFPTKKKGFEQNKGDYTIELKLEKKYKTDPKLSR